MKETKGNAGLLESELMDAFIGDRIGQGINRTVYACKHRPDLVAKIETGAKDFQNISEWKIWEYMNFGRLEEWFAPCEFISSTGIILLQRKTTPILFENLPKIIPSFFCDLKQSNWGLYEGRPVCHDYGLTRLVQKGSNNLKLVEATWIENE